MLFLYLRELEEEKAAERQRKEQEAKMQRKLKEMSVCPLYIVGSRRAPLIHVLVVHMWFPSAPSACRIVGQWNVLALSALFVA
jgi:hypothetical protein